MRSTEAAAVAWPRPRARSVNLSKIQVFKPKTRKQGVKLVCEKNRILTGTFVKEAPRFLSQSCDFLLVKNFQNFRKEERKLVRTCITHRGVRLTGRFASRTFGAP